MRAAASNGRAIHHRQLTGRHDVTCVTRERRQCENRSRRYVRYFTLRPAVTVVSHTRKNVERRRRGSATDLIRSDEENSIDRWSMTMTNPGHYYPGYRVMSISSGIREKGACKRIKAYVDRLEVDFFRMKVFSSPKSDRCERIDRSTNGRKKRTSLRP